MKIKTPAKNPEPAIRELSTFLISTRELSSMTGYSGKWIRKLAVAGFFTPPANGRYKMHEAVQGICKYHRESFQKNRERMELQNRLLKAKCIKSENENAHGSDNLEKQIQGTLVQFVRDLQNGLRLRFQQLAAKLVGKDFADINATLDAVWNEMSNTLLMRGSKAFTESPKTPIEAVHVPYEDPESGPAKYPTMQLPGFPSPEEVWEKNKDKPTHARPAGLSSAGDPYGEEERARVRRENAEAKRGEAAKTEEKK